MNQLKSRRRFLKSVLATGIAAPLSMGGMSQLALAAGNPKLKVVFAVIPDGFGVDAYGGFNNGLWYPDTSATDTTNFVLNEMSQHLGAYKNQALFLKGMIINSGTGGHNGWQYVLRDSAGANSSIDVLLGKAMPGNNPALKRIFSGPHSTIGAPWTISYQDRNKLSPELDPYRLFDDVYGDVSSSSSAQTVVNNRSHLFDPINQQIQTLRSKLGTAERSKLDTHLDAVEQVVTDLGNTVPTGESCNPNAVKPTQGLITSSAEYREPVTKAHANIIASALSCGSSRVATMQIGRSADPVAITSVSTTRNPHDCAHRYGSVTEWKESRAWYTKQVKYLLDRLAAFPDPDVAGDSLLDHTLVVFTSEMADGAPEHMQDVPVTLIGGASGLLKNGNGQGRFLDLKNQGDRSHWKLGTAVDMQRVWTTIAAAAGTTTPYGGDTSTLSGIFTNV
ncbi:MAG: DUF1552 domain-containing protein [Pseudomonadales bacterium]|nr:DUF1552 domain-containing protein [Pseudomonadales bacterium]